MKRVTFFLLLFGIACLQTGTALAGAFSYVYIQGDKQTPIYVKLGDAMMPRYAKNFCIIPQLDPGPIDVTILFQQNAFPEQHFKILVPEGGSRSFLLTNNNGVFSLFDLQQKFSLPAGNTEADDKMPATAVVATPVAVTTPVVSNVAEYTTPEQRPVTIATKQTDTVEATQAALKTPEDSGPKFLNNVSLDGNRTTDTGGHYLKLHELPVADVADTVQTYTYAGKSSEDQAAGMTGNGSENTIRNSDCPSPLPDDAFSKLYKQTLEQATDEDRLAFLGKQMDKCYATWQVRTIANILLLDAARFTLLKELYPHVSDQQSFPLLDDLLHEQAWKDSFQQLVHH